jgi:hypothetical protein
LAGSTKSDDFPTTEICYDNSYSGDYDGFLTIIDPSLSKIEYSTFIGGNLADQIKSMATYDSKNIILIGNTSSLDFPISSDAVKPEIGGRSDGFITKLNVKTNELVYSSFIGGLGGEEISAVEVSDKKGVFLVGRTGSNDFPVTEEALYETISGGADLVVVKLDKTLKNIEYSTYLGGSKSEYFPNTACTNDNELLISLTTKSPDFPVNIKYAEIDSTNMNVLVKFDLNNK